MQGCKQIQRNITENDNLPLDLPDMTEKIQNTLHHKMSSLHELKAIEMHTTQTFDICNSFATSSRFLLYDNKDAPIFANINNNKFPIIPTLRLHFQYVLAL